MAVRIKSITFDCADPCRLAQFWSPVGAYRDSAAGQAPAIERLAAFLGRPRQHRTLSR